MKIDPYKILGIKRDASEKEVRKAFKKKSKETHPDANLDDVSKATSEFQEVSIAYDILSDEQKKGRFDSGLDPDLDINTTAMNFAANTFRGVMMENLRNLGSLNVIDKCMSIVCKKIDEGIHSNTQNEEHRIIIQTFAKRIKRKKKSLKQPLFEDVIATTLNDIDKAVAMNSENIEMLERCKKIFDAYSDVLERGERPQLLRVPSFEEVRISWARTNPTG